MKTQWYFKFSDEEFGPITFDGLVELVRAGLLTHSDLVRPQWNPNWQHADSAVGLFHMAALSAEEVARRRAFGTIAPPPTGVVDCAAEAVDGNSEMQPAWMKRLFELRGDKRPPQAQPPSCATSEIVPEETTIAAVTTESPADSTLLPDSTLAPELTEHEAPSGSQRGLWSNTIAAAVAEIDTRRSRARRESFSSRIASYARKWAGRRQALLRFARDPLVWGGALVTVIFGVQLWFLLAPNSNEANVDRINRAAAVLERVKLERASKPTDAEWEEFVAELNADVEPLLADLASNDEPVSLCLRWAVQYRLPQVLEHGRFQQSAADIAYGYLLQEARRQLDKQ